jgi:hypothetical protein
MNKNNLEEVGFVRPDALKEELSKVKVIGKVDLEKKPKVEVVKVVETKKEEIALCPSYFTQYYG